MMKDVSRRAMLIEPLKIFSSYSGDWFAYEVLTNRIFTIADTLVRDAGNAAADIIREYLIQKGFVTGSMPKNVVWRMSFNEYLDSIRNHIPALVLQITRRCNLHCTYCVYSGNYSHMKPLCEEDMSLETIYRSIDFFAEHNEACSEAAIYFYGGEALLKFDYVRKAVDYIGKAFTKKHPFLRISSNGFSLNRQVFDWLAENPSVNITITLNGPFQDLYRITDSGGGSLERIMENMAVLKEEYPQVWKEQVSFIADTPGAESLPAMETFYRKKVGKLPLEITRLRVQDGNQAIQDILKTDSGKNDDILREEYCETGNSFLEGYYKNGLLLIDQRKIFEPDTPFLIHACMPGETRLFVQCDGSFGICEMACDKLTVGNLSSGFDEQKLRTLYDGMTKLHESCRTCWAQRLCTACLKNGLDSAGNVLEHYPEDFCQKSREAVLNSLRMYCEINHE